jgi:hypothetical protein
VFTSSDFQSLKMDILHGSTVNLEVGCDVSLGNELVVANYRVQPDAKTRSAGILTALAFVPEYFRMMTPNELAAPSQVVIGGPPTDLAQNERLIAAEQIEMFEKQKEAFERNQRLQILAQIEEQLRPIEPGEMRKIGSMDDLECSSKNMVAIVRIDGRELRLRLPSKEGGLHLMSFTPEAGQFQFGCGSKFGDLKAVITYLPDEKPKGKIIGELKAVEFVPPSFDLR